MTEALKAGDIDYARNPTAGPVRLAQGSARTSCTVESTTALRGERLHGARLQHLQQAHRRRRRIDDGAPGPGLPRRARLRHRQAAARRPGPQRPRRRRLDPHPARAWPAASWHLEPQNLRVFDIEVAKQKLEAAGYFLDANGKRLDKENKPIALRMVVPDTSSTYANSAQFITGLVEAARHRHDHPGATTPTRSSS